MVKLARPGAHQGPDPRRGDRGVRALRPRRRARRPHRGARRRQQAHAVLLLPRQGQPVPRRARGALCAHSRRGARARPRAPRAARALRRLVEFTWGYFLEHPEFLTLLNSENLHKGRHVRRSRRVPQMHSTLVETLRGVLKRGERSGVVPHRGRPGSALHLDRRRRLFLPQQPLHPGADLQARPDEQAGAGRARPPQQRHDPPRLNRIVKIDGTDHSRGGRST